MIPESPKHFPAFLTTADGPRHPTKVKLISRNKGEVLKYRDLPKEAQLAIAQYMAVDGEAWLFEDTVLFEGLEDRPVGCSPADSLRIQDRNQNKIAGQIEEILPTIIERKGDSEFGIVDVLTKELIREMWGTNSLLVEEYDTFEEYHEWFVSSDSGYMRDNPTWPVILSSFDDELLQDGWHRFHSYVKIGAEKITCIWYPDGGVKQHDQ